MAGARLRRLQIPWEGFHQATAIRARAAENISAMISNAISGAGHAIGAGIARGKARRQQQSQFESRQAQQQAQFEASMGQRQAEFAANYGLKVQDQRMEQVQDAVRFAQESANSLVAQRNLVMGQMMEMIDSGVPMDSPQYTQLVQQAQALNQQAFDAYGNVQAYARRASDFATSGATARGANQNYPVSINDLWGSTAADAPHGQAGHRCGPGG